MLLWPVPDDCESHANVTDDGRVGTHAATTPATEEAPPTLRVDAAYADGAIAITAADAAVVTSVNERESFMNNLSCKE